MWIIDINRTGLLFIMQLWVQQYRFWADWSTIQGWILTLWLILGILLCTLLLNRTNYKIRFCCWVRGCVLTNGMMIVARLCTMLVNWGIEILLRLWFSRGLVISWRIVMGWLRLIWLRTRWGIYFLMSRPARFRISTLCTETDIQTIRQWLRRCWMHLELEILWVCLRPNRKGPNQKTSKRRKYRNWLPGKRTYTRCISLSRSITGWRLLHFLISNFTRGLERVLLVRCIWLKKMERINFMQWRLSESRGFLELICTDIFRQRRIFFLCSTILSLLNCDMHFRPRLIYFWWWISAKVVIYQNC